MIVVGTVVIFQGPPGIGKTEYLHGVERKVNSEGHMKYTREDGSSGEFTRLSLYDVLSRHEQGLPRSANFRWVLVLDEFHMMSLGKRHFSDI